MKSNLNSLRGSLVLLDIFDLFCFFVLVLSLVCVIRLFVFNPFTVYGQSMQPNFEHGDFIIVDKITPKTSGLKRGDVVVFVPNEGTKPYIKRIVGLQGETVMIKDGYMHICNGIYETPRAAELSNDCERLQEDYIPDSDDFQTYVGNEQTINTPFVFPINEEGYFVSGDNREVSSDSRVCFDGNCSEGESYLVTDDILLGVVRTRLWPQFVRY